MLRKNHAKIVALDRIMYLMGIAIPVLTSSQVLKIWLNKNAEGVSLLAWVTYAVNSLLWVYYGKLHRKKPVVFANLMCFVINIMVVVGTIVYS